MGDRDYVSPKFLENDFVKQSTYNDKQIVEKLEYNKSYKPLHDTYKKILIDANTYAGKANIDGFQPYFSDANHITGFYAKAYKNSKTKTIVIAYKGSDTWSIANDWIENNAYMAIIKRVPFQFKDAEQFYFDVRAKLGNEIGYYKFDFAGYSLGGTLAELMGAKYGNETVTFNAFGAATLKNATINFTNNIINYGNVDDVVFNWNNTKHIGKIILTKNDSINKSFYYNHELENLGVLEEQIIKTKELN